MKLHRLVFREILHRKLTFALGVVSVAVAVACLVGALAILQKHDARTEQIIAAKEAETQQQMAKLEDDYRKVMLKMGFNVLILPKDQNLSDLYADDFASKYMPEEYATRLATNRVVTINHILPSLQQKVKWPEQGRTILLMGLRGEVYIQSKQQKPLLEPVAAGTMNVGSELARNLSLGRPVLAMTINLLRGFNLGTLGHNSAEYIHVVTEALKLAFADRHHHFGDPRFVEVPLKGLMSDDYAAHRRMLIRPDRAWPGMPPAGDPDTNGQLANRWLPPPQSDEAPGPGDTSYLCCIDRHGNAFSATPSDGSNNSPIVPGVGIVCSGRGTQSWADPTHPCSVAPGKRPRLTPSPALALKGGRG